MKRDLEYFRIHNWLSYHHGKASRCENELCQSIYPEPKQFEWALLKGKEHKRNRNNYIQLCSSCHRKYDFTEELRKKFSESHKGQSPTNKRKVILNNSEVFNSLTEASKSKGVSMSSIWSNLNGVSKITKLGTWKYL
jgi:hypothetical protein